MNRSLRIFFAATFVLAATGVSCDQELAVVTHSLTVEERLETIETIDVTSYKELKAADKDSMDGDVAEILDEAENAESEKKAQDSESEQD